MVHVLLVQNVCDGDMNARIEAVNHSTPLRQIVTVWDMYEYARQKGVFLEDVECAGNETEARSMDGEVLSLGKRSASHGYL